MPCIFLKVLLCISLAGLPFACTRVELTPNLGPDDTPSELLSSDAFLNPAYQSDEELANVRRLDALSRSTPGGFESLAAIDHLQRAAIYMANRAFPEAREHWLLFIARYPAHPGVPAALFGIGRSFYQEQRFEDALGYFERAGATYNQTKEGRDSFYFVAPTLLRLGRAMEAASRYREYTERFPAGEKVTDAYLNVIDTLREAGQPAEALAWAGRTRRQFANTATDVNALFAILRLEMAARDWNKALDAANELSRSEFSRDVKTTPSEVAYLRAYCLEQLNMTELAIKSYQAITTGADSYYGSLATAKLDGFTALARTSAMARARAFRLQVLRTINSYPVPFREAILRSSRQNNVDPRLVLAIMRQESQFNPEARSPAAARGLMQLTMDAATKYAPGAGFSSITEQDLYKPATSIAIACVYLAKLNGLFPGAFEAIAASYNGGEDNVARWLRRAGNNDPGVFTAEIGYSETKGYVAKVITNYRAYQLLYDSNLRRRNLNRFVYGSGQYACPANPLECSRRLRASGAG